MATTIKHKRGTAAPTGGDLAAGELGLDTTNKRIYTSTNGTDIIETGVNPAAEIQANAGIALPDSQKATFGASDDLQIYHDGSNSRIVDTGTGSLILQSNQLVFKSADDSEILGYSDENGAFNLYYNGSPKLSTTSTGIDVTGTVTADGLTVSKPGSQQIYFDRNGSSIGSGSIGADVSQAMGIWDTDDNKVATFYQNQDVAFYEDTGTTAKFFWDASAESLGIGTSSPSYPLHILGSHTIYGAELATSSTATTSYNVMRFTQGTGSGAPIGYVGTGGSATSNSGFAGAFGIGTQTSAPVTFLTNDAERMRIDSSGNLLVGKTTANNTTVGFTVYNDNGYSVVRDSNPVGIYNRLTTDGDIAVFRKDGTTVGSIGTYDGRPYLASTTLGIRVSNALFPSNTSGVITDGACDIGGASGRFKDLYLSGEAKVTSSGVDGTYSPILRGIYSGNSNETNTIETTVSSAAANSGFKFNVSNGGGSSGQTEALRITRAGTYAPLGIHLGGTGSANHLDDYETGTFTPTLTNISGGAITYTTQTGRYAKVGDLVTVEYKITVNTNTHTTGNVAVGLPFSSGYSGVVGNGSVVINTTTVSDLTGHSFFSTDASSQLTRSGGNYVTATQITNGITLSGFIVYRTA